MAKNYTLKEAANIIAEGTKKDEIIDIGRRFPLLAVSLTANIAKAGETFLDFINYMPEYMTANKVNSLMKAGVYDTSADNATDEEVEEKPAKKPAKKAKVEAESEVEPDEDGSYESMTAVELFKECKKRGIKKAVPKKPAEFYIDLLNKDDKSKADSESEDEDWEEVEEKPAKKPAKKAEKKAEKKPAKKPEPVEEEADEDDEDDDWDI